MLHLPRSSFIKKMRTLRNSLSISSLLLRSSTINRPFSSCSSSNLQTHVPSSSSSDSLIPQKSISQNPISNEFPHSNDPKIANLQIPISKCHQDFTNLYQSHVISVLLSLKNNHLSAIRYFMWAEQQPGFNGGVESFCVLFHIVVSSNSKKKLRLVKDLITSKQCCDATLVNHGLIESAKKYDFGVNALAFQYLLDGFVRVNRIDDAIVCFNFIVENFGAELRVTFANHVLKTLVKKERLVEVRELLSKMVANGMNGKNRIFLQMMNLCVSKGKSNEAVELFRMARDLGFKLDDRTYKCAIDIVSKKPDIDAACELMEEMMEKFSVPSTATYTNLIRKCVRHKRMEEALRLKDEMISSGEPMDIMAATYLMKGYCESGDLESALSLFTEMIEDGNSPKRFTFLVLIKGCCQKGNMDKACELHKLMIEKGFQLSFYLTLLLIEGLLDARLWEEACKHLSLVAESDVIRPTSFNLLMSYLCSEGKVDEARQLLEKLAETGSIPTVINIKYLHKVVCKGSKPCAVTYAILMDGHFKKGEVEKALELFDEIVDKKIDCTAFTYNTIIHGLCCNGQTSRARKILAIFPKGGIFEPSFTTYKFLVDGFIKEGDMDSALSITTEMSEKGLSGDCMLKKNVVDKLCERSNILCAWQKLKKMVDKNSQLDVSAYEALIYKFCNNRKMSTALRLYAELIDAGLLPSQYILKCLVKGYQLVDEWDISNFSELVKDGAEESTAL